MDKITFQGLIQKMKPGAWDYEPLHMEQPYPFRGQHSFLEDDTRMQDGLAQR